MNPLSLLLGGISGLGQIGYGLFQTIHGNHKLNQLQRPQYSPDENITFNRNLAAQNANTGLGDQSLQIATDAAERGLGTTVNAGLSTGQGLSGANRAYQNQIDSFKDLSFADAQQKMKNQEALMNANKDLSTENLRAFDYNKNQPYQLAYSKYTQQTNAGPQNIFGGLNQIGSMFSPFGNGNKNDSGTTQPNSGYQFNPNWAQFLSTVNNNAGQNYQYP